MSERIFGSLEEALAAIRKPIKNPDIHWYYGPYGMTTRIKSPFGDIIVSVEKSGVYLHYADNFRISAAFPKVEENV